MLNAKLEAKKKADEEKRKEEEEASFIPSNFASGPRRRVGAAITRPRALVPTVNPCLVKAPNPCLVKAPNPCLVKAPNPCLVKDLSSEKPTDSKRASSGEASRMKETGGEKKKHESKHKDKDRHKHKHKDRENTTYSSNTAGLLAEKQRKNTSPALGVKTDSKSGSVKKIKKKKPIIKKPPGKPPLSFEQLLQIAQKKHTIPVDTPVVKVKEPEEQRPMTKEEKEQYLRRHTKAYQAWLKFGKQPPAEKLAEANDRKKTKLLEEAATSSKHATPSVKKHNMNTKVPGNSKSVTNNKALGQSELYSEMAEQNTHTKERGKSRPCSEMAEQNTHTKERGKSRPCSEMAEQNTHTKVPGKTKRCVTAGTGSSMNSFKHPGGVEKPHKPSAGVCNPKVHLKTENGVRKTAPKILQRDDVNARINGCNNSAQQNMSKLKSPYSTMRKPSHAPPSVNGSGRYISTRETVLKCGSQVKMVKASPVTERVKPTNPWDRIYGEIQKNNPKPGR